jgi:hypothetical protein
MGAGYGGVHGRVRRRREWAGGGMVGASRFVRPVRVRRVATGYWAQTSLRAEGPAVAEVPQRPGPVGVAARATCDVGAAGALWSA